VPYYFISIAVNEIAFLFPKTDANINILQKPQ
jgi:hypothetical protein